MRNPTFQLITGSVLVLLNVVAVLAGLCVIGHCLPRIAEGRMTASLPILGDITGANAELVGLFVGFAIVIVGLTYWGMHLTPEAPRSSIRALEDYSRTLGSFKSASPSGFKVNRCRPPAGRNERRL